MSSTKMLRDWFSVFRKRKMEIEHALSFGSAGVQPDFADFLERFRDSWPAREGEAGIPVRTLFRNKKFLMTSLVGSRREGDVVLSFQPGVNSNKIICQILKFTNFNENQSKTFSKSDRIF